MAFCEHLDARMVADAMENPRRPDLDGAAKAIVRRTRMIAAARTTSRPAHQDRCLADGDAGRAWDLGRTFRAPLLEDRQVSMAPG